MLYGVSEPDFPINFRAGENTMKNEHTKDKHDGQKSHSAKQERKHTVLVGLLLLALLLTGLNTYQLSILKPMMNAQMLQMAQAVPAAGSGSGNAQPVSDVIPQGVPSVYGEELGVSYDMIDAGNPQGTDAAIRRLAALDQTITPEGDDLERYIRIAKQISCEYCCGAPSVIFDNGQAACGCAHSYAMRGIAKYLITEHADEYSDEEILAEMGKWKVLFFPQQHMAKAAALEGKGIEVDYVNLASNKYRGIEKGSEQGGMVGGC